MALPSALGGRTGRRRRLRPHGPDRQVKLDLRIWAGVGERVGRVGRNVEPFAGTERDIGRHGWSRLVGPLRPQNDAGVLGGPAAADDLPGLDNEGERTGEREVVLEV